MTPLYLEVKAKPRSAGGEDKPVEDADTDVQPVQDNLQDGVAFQEEDEEMLIDDDDDGDYDDDGANQGSTQYQIYKLISIKCRYFCR